MRKPKAAWLIVALSSFLGIAVLTGWMLWPSKTIAMKKQFDQVKIGMTEAEVEAILGPPTEKPEVLGAEWRRPKLLNGRQAPIILPFYYVGADGSIIEIDFDHGEVTNKRLADR